MPPFIISCLTSFLMTMVFVGYYHHRTLSDYRHMVKFGLTGPTPADQGSIRKRYAIGWLYLPIRTDALLVNHLLTNFRFYGWWYVGSCLLNVLIALIKGVV